MKKELTFLSHGGMILWTAMMCMLCQSHLLANNGENAETGFLYLGYSVPIDVSGTVTNSKGEALIGANVLVKETGIGTGTDLDGRFELTNISDDAILVVSYVGYQTQEVSVQGQSVLKIILKENLNMLDEVVVVGYGTQSREFVTASVSTLDSKVLENVALGNIGSALQGTIPGLRVTNNSGQPGTAPSILLRGGASINSPGGPLVVIDGVVRTMNDINSADVESISVLKDAASTAIYGARANNGVILITTKRGKSGESNVTYSVKAGVNRLRESYDYVNARDYIYYNRRAVLMTNLNRRQGGTGDYNPEKFSGFGDINPQMYDLRIISDANRSDYQSLINDGWQSMLDPYANGEDTIMFRDYGGQIGDAAFNKSAYTQDHNLSFSGGNQKGKFSASLNSYTEDGLVIDTKYQRISGTFNGSYNVKDNVEILAGVTYSNSKRPAFLPGDIFFRTQSMQPTFIPFIDGIPNSGSSLSYGNPLYYVDKYIRKNNTRRSIFNVGANWEIMPDLFLRAKANLYYTDYAVENFNKKIEYQTGNIDVNRNSSASYNKSSQQQHNITLDYKKSFNQHKLSLLVGGEYFDLNSWQLSAAGKAAPTDEIYTLNAAVDRTSISSATSDYRMLSGFSRLNYAYNSKYLLTAVMRYDGVSSLTDNRWGAFPGLSVGWNVHQEDFFKSSSLGNFISILKPRMGYGVNGNISGIGNYEVQGTYGIQTFYDKQAGYLNTGVINNGLRWEKSKSLDIGLEIGMLDYRINLDMTYFRRTTTDLLTNLALPDYTGFNGVRTNLGNLQNAGFETQANINILKLDNGIRWNLGLNVSYVVNKILKLPYNGNEKNRQGGIQVYDPEAGKLIWVTGYQEGETFGDVYGFKQERILRDWDDVNQTIPNRYDAIAVLYGPAAYAGLDDKSGKYPIEPGDVLWADQDKNDTIDLRDMVKMGNIFPKWTGGFSSTISYKNFSLFGRFDFGVGHIIYNDLKARIMGQYVGTMNIIEDVKETWSEENPDSKYPRFLFADYPSLNIKRWGWLDQSEVNGKNSVFYEKGDYLAMREVTLSYMVPKSATSKLKASSMQVYFTGQNLAYFTKEYSGTSPESGGVDVGKYPMPRTFIMGLQVTF